MSSAHEGVEIEPQAEKDKIEESRRISACFSCTVILTLRWAIALKRTMKCYKKNKMLLENLSRLMKKFCLVLHLEKSLNVGFKKEKENLRIFRDET